VDSRKKILFSHEQIGKRVREIAERISGDFKDREIVFIGVLKGAYIFLSDLSRQVTAPHVIDFVRLASYGSGTVSSGSVKITKDIEVDVRGKHVVIVEDIIDSGLTLAYLKGRLGEAGAASVAVCTLLDKKTRREVPIDADYVGFVIDDGFVVGYGLDYNEQYRSLPDVYVIEE